MVTPGFAENVEGGRRELRIFSSLSAAAGLAQRGFGDGLRALFSFSFARRTATICQENEDQAMLVIKR